MFESIESTLYPIVCDINTYLSNYILVFLLIGVGLWYSIKTRFVQLRCFKEGWNSVFGNLSLRGKKHDSGMSSFQALATAIAAQVGTGNIVGASGAILTGGPGAIFWMWIIAFLGMATIYAEATLAQETRIVEKDGNVKGGPVYYITTAFKGGFGKFLAGFFAVAITLHSASSAAWCSPTPSAPRCRPPLAFPPGSSVSSSSRSARSSSLAAYSASPPSRRRSSPSWRPSSCSAA